MYTTREAVGTWIPETWPAIGERFYLPDESGGYSNVDVVGVHPPTHIVVTIDRGPRMIGRPDLAMIDGLKERIWNFYDIEDYWSPT
jgi:hypothetical protein